MVFSKDNRFLINFNHAITTVVQPKSHYEQVSNHIILHYYAMSHHTNRATINNNHPVKHHSYSIMQYNHAHQPLTVAIYLLKLPIITIMCLVVHNLLLLIIMNIYYAVHQGFPLLRLLGIDL